MKRIDQDAGIRRGGAVFVHSSLKANGADVSPQEVIAALRDAVGDDGTLLLPTFTDRKEDVFDPATTPSAVGAVTEVFRAMPGVVRSRHPRHPVAAQGPLAEALLTDHEKAVGPCGADTPFERHARTPSSQVLLIGVDLDTLTLLHTAEALLDLAYLRDLDGSYLDIPGNAHTMTMRQAPGGHRGGVRAFEKVLRAKNLVRYGTFGDARTMIFDAGPLLDAMIEWLRGDPMGALCAHNACADCNWFKGRIRARRFTEDGINLVIALPQPPDDAKRFEQMLTAWGTPGLHETHADLPAGAYRPLDAARSGRHPFYDFMYKGAFRDSVTDVIVEDGITELQGFVAPAQQYIPAIHGNDASLGNGHAQLREIVSAMRMRQAPLNYHLVIGAGDPFVETWRSLNAFWRLLP